jgi:hypothetical protein
MVGGQLGRRLNTCGVGGAWEGQTAHVYDHQLPPLVRPVDAPMRVWGETALQAAAGDRSPLKRCAPGEGNDRRLGETVWSRRTGVPHVQKVRQRMWDDVQARVALTRAAFTRLAPWSGLPVHEDGLVPRSIAVFSL